ncbi:MAG: hypothetical protein NVSMB34_04510 [Variovorax sp.]
MSAAGGAADLATADLVASFPGLAAVEVDEGVTGVAFLAGVRWRTRGEGAADVATTGNAAAFNGFSVPDSALAGVAGRTGFFEWGMRTPRYIRNGRAENTSTGIGAGAGMQGSEENAFLKARCRANIWCAVLAVV